MRLIPQLYNNDCLIACVCMVTGLPYADVLRSCIASGFTPDNTKGLHADLVLNELGYDWAYIEPHCNLMGCSPSIVLIKIASEGEAHAVVVNAGKVYDPNTKDPLSLDYIERNAIGMVSHIRESRRWA